MLADKAGAPKDKPRLGAAVFKLWANKSGPTSYKLTCSGGRQWSGTLNTFKVADKKYQAVGQHNFQIDKTEVIGCALRSTSLDSNAVVAIASKQFELVKRNPQVGELPDDVKDPGRPTSRPPQNAKDKREAARKAAELRRKRAAAKKAAELRRKRAAAKKAAELRRKRAAAKKAAELRRKRAAAKRAAQLRRKRQAARRAAQQRKRQQRLKAKRRALKLRRNR